MEKLEFQIEFITPAFIGGANPRESAELRPTSFVGLLRWWYRAILRHQVKSFKELYEKESELFGSQEKAGRVWIRIKGNVKGELKNCQTWRANNERDTDWGKVYLGYGNILYINFEREENRESYSQLYKLCGNKRGNFTVRAWLEKKQNANLQILVPKHLKEKVEALLFLFSQIGSIGSRNRRGWGSLYLKPLYESEYKNWNNWNKEEFKRVLQILGGVPPNMEIYKLNESYANPLEALEEIGRKYRTFRSRRSPDYRNVKDFLQTGTFKGHTVERAYFGLPLSFKFRSLNQKEAQLICKADRLSSPVRFRVVRLPDGKFTCLVVHFETKEDEMPEDFKILDKQNRKQISIAKPSSKIFKDFVNTHKLQREVP
ncbi:type III-B CRISPR module RAMP protein Cmr1 [Hydrogenobacter hydrogenophilus]|uniref:CRISPR-associated protein Cmr1 n=1 Tax=Hydrogenobacter hydrogenophilus TaxID=35835 RepID=A0A285P309_9AQUI|nr:type III-B CRISPR module RAMP protein Cmr1 [Hydrogenobacter hydrogenophilus]SNZ16115.1 CRISPR-associated protein Cmr1 [Hydrogenobacter hydrogenophilus]